MNITRLLIVAGLIGWFISTWGLIGAVLVTLAGTTIVKAAALGRIARLMHVGFAEGAAVEAARHSGRSRHRGRRAGVIPMRFVSAFGSAFVSAPFLSVAIGGTAYAAALQV